MREGYKGDSRYEVEAAGRLVMQSEVSRWRRRGTDMEGEEEEVVCVRQLLGRGRGQGEEERRLRRAQLSVQLHCKVPCG